VYVNTGKVTPEQLQVATYDELLDLKLKVDEDIGEIQIKITQAKAKAVKGEFSNPDWFARINTAKHIKRALSQRLQREIGKRGKAEREQRNVKHESSYSERLHRAMDEVLDPQTKQKILQLAQAQVG
jgi:hypothetical protein